MKTKALFVHDHKISIHEGGLYSRGGLTPQLITNYESYFGEVSLCTRKLITDDTSKLISLHKSEDFFVEFPDVLASKLVTLPKAFKVIKNIIKNYDFLIIRLPSISGLIAIYYARKYKKKYILEVVGCPLDSLFNYGGLKGKLLAPIMYNLNKYFINLSQNVIYVSKEFLPNRYPSSGENVASCSDVEVNTDGAVLNNRIEAIKRRESKQIVLGMIGNLDSKYKGFDLAIAALSDLVYGKGGDYYLEIVGGGNKELIYKLAEKHKVASRVKLIGTLSHPIGINEWLDKVDIYLQPSKQEGLPRALVEAFSRGCTCIGSAVGGIPELLKKECIFNRYSSGELAKKIEEFSSNEMLLLYAEINFQKAREYDADTLKEIRNRFYYNVIEGVY